MNIMPVFVAYSIVSLLSLVAIGLSISAYLSVKQQEKRTHKYEEEQR